MGRKSARRGAGRPRVGEEPLTREGILRSALRLVDEGGIGALSMRRLAGELGVDPMAIYHHLPGKGAVFSGLAEIVFAEMRVPAPSGSWQDRVRAWAHAYHGLARAHPNFVTQLVTEAPVAATATLEAGEALYEAFEASGMPPGTVVRAVDLVVDYVNGFALGEVGGPLGRPEDRRELLEQLEARPPEQFPTMRRLFGGLAGAELAADFGFGLDAIIAGLEARAGNPGPAS